MKIAFYKGPRKGVWRAVSPFVRWWTGGPYCHAELVFPDGRSMTASIGTGGLVVVRKQYDPAHWDFVAIDADIYSNAAWRWAEAHLGAKFDTLGVFAFLFRPTRGREDRWFCSEAVAAALGFSDAWRFDPNTLHAVVRRKVAIHDD